MVNPLTSSTIVYKQPTETLRLGVDFSPWIASADILSSPSVTSLKIGGGSSGLTITSITVATQNINFTVASGIVGRHRIEVGVTVSDGQVLEADGILIISDI